MASKLLSNDEFSNYYLLFKHYGHLVIGGNFSVDFNGNRTHAAVPKSFCDNPNIHSVVYHDKSQVNYAQNFDIAR